VLEEAPAPEPAEPPTRATRAVRLLPVSARTAPALEAACANLAEALREAPEMELSDVAFTLQTGRRGFAHRRAVLARDAETAAAALASPAGELAGIAGIAGVDAPRSVVFLFPGLGDQYLDMGRELYQAEAVFREEVDRCAALLEPLLGLDLRRVIFTQGERTQRASADGLDLRALLRRDGPADDPAAARLAETAVAQPAHFVVEYALARLLMSWGVRPKAMIGYSIGEYVAACLAGALSLEDALRLVAKRARLIQELPLGAMLAVPLAEEEVRPLLTDARLSLCATNGPHFCVAGGPEEAVAELERGLEGRGVSCLRLQATHAYHSSMMEPAVAPFTEIARTVRVNAAEIPWLSNVTGTWITPEDLADPSYWARHMRNTVRFAEGAGELLADPGRIYLEVGPGATLGTLVRQHPAAPAGLVTLSAMRRGSERRSDVEHLLEAVGRLWAAGGAVEWAGLWAGERRRRVPLPTYPFERQRCWIDPPSAGRLAGTATQAAGTGPRPDLADWFSVPVWKQAPPARPVASSRAGEGGSWLLFLDRCGVGERLAERLRQGGSEVLTVAAGDAFAADGEGAWRLDPGAREDYDALVHALRDRAPGGALPERIVHLWSLTRDEPGFDQAQRLGLRSLVLLAQAIATADAGGSSPVRIAVVANQLGEVLEGDRVVPAKATLLGACKVMHQESERLHCGAIDVALPAAGPQAEERLAGQLVAEVAGELPARVAYRGDARGLRDFAPVRLGAEASAASRLRRGGAYLVTDGVHGCGPAVAEHLLRAVEARVALLVPPEFPERERWESWQGLPEVPPGQDAIGSTIRRLLELERQSGLGGLVLVRGDGSPSALRQAVSEARERLGGLDGVFHTPAPFVGGLIQLKSAEALEAALGPVARGTEALFEALDEIPEGGPVLVVLASSTLAITGGLGQLDIAAAGAWLDAFAERRSAEGGPFTVAVAWDPYQWEGWLAGGAGAVFEPEAVKASLAAHGVPAARSGEALERLLAASLPRVVVSSSDLAALIEQSDAFTAESFLAAAGKARPGERQGRGALSSEYVEPAPGLESEIAALWEELFGIAPVGARDDFLELGGHSLLAIQLMTQIRTIAGVELPVMALFDAPTVAGLAAAVERERQAAEEPEDLEKLLALVEGLSPEEAVQHLSQIGDAPEEAAR
jgi:acyl transferase domain-containing protein